MTQKVFPGFRNDVSNKPMHHSLPPEDIIKCDILALQPRTNVHHVMAEANTVRRALEFGVATEQTIIKFRRSNYCLHASMCHPDLPLDALEICSDWHFWLWTVDDRLDTGDLSTPGPTLVEFLSSAYNITRGLPTTVNDPHLRWLKFVSDRLPPSPKGRDFFAQAVDEYLRASIKPGELEATNLEAYIAHRLRDSACKTVFALVRLYSKSTFSPLEHSLLLNLEYQINLVLSVFNDIVSFENEQKTDRGRWNTLSVLQAVGQLKTEATIRATQMVNDAWSTAKRSHSQLENKECGQALMDLTVGSCFWSINSPRYQK